MNYNEVIQKLVVYPSYFKKGATFLSRLWGVEEEVIIDAKREAKEMLSGDSTNREKAGFVPEDSIDFSKLRIKKVWETTTGEWRSSWEAKPTDTVALDEWEKKFRAILESHISKPSTIVKGVKGSSKKVLIVYISDEHIGAYIDPETSLYSNEHDIQKKVDDLLSNIISILNKEDISNIVINFLGDTFDGMDGETTRGGHALVQNLSNIQAFDLFLSIYMKFFDSLLSSHAFDSFRVHFCANNNHGGDMDYMGYKAISMYLETKWPSVFTHIITQFIGHFNVGKHIFMISHGKDKKDLKRGLPLNLDERTEGFISDYIFNYRLAGFLHFIKGDLHQNNTNFGKRFRYRNVGSLFGSSEWIMNNFGKTEPSVAYDIVDPTGNNVLEGIIRF